jgi:hypothetical protein
MYEQTEAFTRYRDARRQHVRHQPLALRRPTPRPEGGAYFSSAPVSNGLLHVAPVANRRRVGEVVCRFADRIEYLPLALALACPVAPRASRSIMRAVAHKVRKSFREDAHCRNRVQDRRRL